MESDGKYLCDAKTTLSVMAEQSEASIQCIPIDLIVQWILRFAPPLAYSVIISLV